jgi:tRNA pseudouridine38-40 synthase
LDKSEIRNRKSEIVIDFSAKSFLHHQVRNMVGTLVEIGLGKDMDIDEILAAKNRGAAGPTAPASGLYFVSAEY